MVSALPVKSTQRIHKICIFLNFLWYNILLTTCLLYVVFKCLFTASLINLVYISTKNIASEHALWETICYVIVITQDEYDILVITRVRGKTED